MKTEYSIELLDKNYVSIKITTLNYDGKKIGDSHRRMYLNNEKERQELISDMPEYIQNAIFAMWDREEA